MTSVLDTRRVFTAIVGIGVFAMAVRNLTDPDVWWHLRTGQLILQNHAVFHADPYSFTKFGQPWVNHEWLSDVLIYALYRAAGCAGPIVAFGASASAAFMVVFFRSEGRISIAGLFTVWAATASAPSWGVRPQTLSLLFASLFLILLERSRTRPNLLWWILPLTAVWVNVHGEFALGIGLVLLTLIGELLDAALGFQNWDTASPTVRKLFLTLAGSLAIVPLNPYGTRMYLYPLQTVHSRSIQAYISEWGSPNFHQGMYLPALLLLLATFVVVAVSSQRLRPRELLLLSVTVWAALHSARHVPIYALVAAPILSKGVSAWLDENGHRFRGRLNPAADSAPHKLLNGMLLGAFLILAILKVRHILDTEKQDEARLFPSSAVSYMHESRLPGPIFNSYNWGGYLIWRLYPDCPVYIDGRSDLYGNVFMDQFAGTYQVSNAAWARALDEWRIQTIILPPDAPLIAALRLVPGWRQVFEDSQAVVLSRSQPPHNQ